MILNRVPEEEQFTESLRSMPKDKPFSISFAFPEAIQTWHEEVMDEFWHHLEQTTGAQVHFSAVDTCALCGPLTSIYSAHMMIIQKARDFEIKEFEAKQETGNGLVYYEYMCPRSAGAVERRAKHAQAEEVVAATSQGLGSGTLSPHANETGGCLPPGLALGKSESKRQRHWKRQYDWRAEGRPW